MQQLFLPTRRSLLLLVYPDNQNGPFQTERHHRHQGAMCKCFVAQGNPQYPEPVVLKLAIENGPREAERDLNRELSLLHSLSHPNLTALLGSGQTPKGKT